MRTLLRIALSGFALVASSSVDVSADHSNEEVAEHTTEQPNGDEVQTPLSVVYGADEEQEDVTHSSQHSGDILMIGAASVPPDSTEIEVGSTNSTTTSQPDVSSHPSDSDSLNDGDSVSSHADDDGAEEAASAADVDQDEVPDESVAVEDLSNQGHEDGIVQATDGEDANEVMENGDVGGDEEIADNIDALSLVDAVEPEETTSTVAPESEQTTDMVV